MHLNMADPDAPQQAVSMAPPAAAGAASKGEEKLPLLEDVMQLARLGDVKAMQDLFEKGKITAEFKDQEGITPLHWAAINNHYAMCKFLIDSGADINARGGEAVATPAMWAAQRCNYYIVQLLLKSGADVLLTDVQGYNILHLATFDGNLFLLTLLLHQDIPVDSPDFQGHTCLMWAAYKGLPSVVDLFLRWGANVNLKDENGFTALHWSLVKGSLGCVSKLIEYGSSRYGETNDGKTPRVVAGEMKTLGVWYRALAECGFKPDGEPKKLPAGISTFLSSKEAVARFFYILPFFVIFTGIYILSHTQIFIGVPAFLAFVYSSQWMANKLLAYAPTDMNNLHKTPYLSGVFSATLFWVGIRWFTAVLPGTYQTHFFLNLLFALLLGSCGYFYYLAMVENPGFVPKLPSRSDQKAVIDELLSLWKFDDQNFCVQCMIRTPLRSKHCRRCKRCVAKHDHHCPWIHNCVGSNNLRHFVIYIASLEIGIAIFIRLVLYYLESSPAPSSPTCNLISEAICGVILRDPFTTVLTLWSALQLTWVSMLLFVQFIQISRATTTYEAMKGHHSAEDPHSASSALTAAVVTGSTTMDLSNPSAQAPSGHAHAHGGQGCFDQWKKLLGLDTFMATAQSGLDSSSARRRNRNPYSRGVITNCRDFWCDPAPVFGRRDAGDAMLDGQVVNYARMYELPPRMKRSGASSGQAYQSVGTEEEV